MNNFKELQKQWDEIFKRNDPYTDVYRGAFFYNWFIEKYKNKIKNNWIFDIGCGDLFYLDDLIEEGVTLVGIDFSKEALKLAKKLIKSYEEENLKVNVHLIQADARYLPLKEKVSDITISSETLMNLLDDFEKGLEEIKKISKDKIIFTLHAKELYEKGNYNLKNNIVIDFSKPYRRVFSKKEVKKLPDIKNIKTFQLGDLEIPQYDELWSGDQCNFWPSDLPPPNTKAVYLVTIKTKKKVFLKDF